jgi:hypothetical protein
LFFLFWLVLPVGIVLFLLKARRHFGGGNPPWLTEWHRRMHERDVTSPPPGTSRPDVQAEGSGTA